MFDFFFKKKAKANKDDSTSRKPPVTESSDQTRRHKTNAQKSSHADEDQDLKPDDIVIAVMGPTGSGKSTLISAASGSDTKGVGHTLKPFTTQVLPIRFWDQESRRHVVLVDTPGFDHTPKSDSDILNMISEWLNSSYDKDKLLSGILYLHRITDNRVTGTPLKNLRPFRKLCGEDALKRVYFVTTMWDEVDPVVGKRRLNELSADHWKAMIDNGAQIACCRVDDNSPEEIFRRILGQWGAREVLLTQPKMVERKKERKETSVGQLVEEDMVSRQGPPYAAKEPATVNIEDLEPDDIVIAVMGPTGSGKSTIISSASGSDTKGVGHTLKPFTAQVLPIRFWDQESRRHVVLVDTPGLDDSYQSDLNILTTISRWLSSSYDKDKLLSGILYLHRITDNRMTGTPLQNLRLFRELCGKDALEKVYFTTTMWDEVDEEVGKKRLEELCAEYWAPMLKMGAQIARCRSGDDSPKNLIRDILLREDERRALQLQLGMGKENKELKETAAGQQLYSQLEKLVEKQSELLRRIAKERKGTLDPGALVELQAASNDLREQIDDRLRQMQESKSSWFKSLHRQSKR